MWSSGITRSGSLGTSYDVYPNCNHRGCTRNFVRHLSHKEEDDLSSSFLDLLHYHFALSIAYQLVVNFERDCYVSGSIHNRFTHSECPSRRFIFWIRSDPGCYHPLDLLGVARRAARARPNAGIATESRRSVEVFARLSKIW